MSYFYFSIEILPFILSAILAIIIAVISLRYRNEDAAQYLFLTMLTIFGWTSSYILEISSTLLFQKIIFANIQFLFISLLPLLWLLTTRELFGKKYLGNLFIAVLLIIPLITNILAWIDLDNNFFRLNPVLDHSIPGLTLLQANYGWWHDLIFASYQYIIYGYIFLFQLRYLTDAKSIYRRQTLLIIIGTITPFIGGTLYFIKVPPFANLNPTSALFSITGITFAKAIFRHHMLDVLPLARERIFEKLPNPVIIMDIKNRILDFNEQIKKIFPRMHTNHIGEYIHEQFNYISYLYFAPQYKSSRNEIYICNPESSEKKTAKSHVVFKAYYNEITRASSLPLARILIFSDISEQVALNEELDHMAVTDPLTGLFNRRKFFSQSMIEFQRTKRFKHNLSLILLDLDNFKRINDTFGHQIGDKILQMVGYTIKDNVREIDICGRYGGEEFAITLPETNLEQANITAKRLMEKFHYMSIPAGNSVKENLRISASFGVAAFTDGKDQDFEEMIRMADKALYKAKDEGKDRIISYEDEI